MLTRTHFESACRALAAKYQSESSLPSAFHQWTWVEKYPYNYLTRTKQYFLSSRPTSFADSGLGDDDDLVTEDDQDVATAPVTVETGDVISQQFVVLSASFQVPAFYFTAHNTSVSYVLLHNAPLIKHFSQDGTPLSLDELMQTTLFKFQAPIGSEANGFALTLPEAPFPLLSQGDHPTLGTPCWYLHPCETAVAVDELFQEVVQEGWDEETRLVRWLEMWLLTVSTVLDL